MWRNLANEAEKPCLYTVQWAKLPAYSPSLQGWDSHLTWVPCKVTTTNRISIRSAVLAHHARDHRSEQSASHPFCSRCGLKFRIYNPRIRQRKDKRTPAATGLVCACAQVCHTLSVASAAKTFITEWNLTIWRQSWVIHSLFDSFIATNDRAATFAHSMELFWMFIPFITKLWS